jgi:hypothetical protein
MAYQKRGTICALVNVQELLFPADRQSVGHLLYKDADW